MKKIALLLCIFLGTFILFSRINTSKTIQQKNVLSTFSSVSPTPTPIPVGTPIHISIPAIGVDAAVESVGLDTQGRMDVPTNNIDTAWYKLGYKPGDKGSAVIDGHFDTPTGAAAVFYNISKLKNGDTISVKDSFDHVYTFIVTQVASYPFDQLPMQQIFANSNSAELNLITCDGTWSRQTHNYSNRAVIYSVLQNQ